MAVTAEYPVHGVLVLRLLPAQEQPLAGVLGLLSPLDGGRLFAWGEDKRGGEVAADRTHG
ncbi:MAG: hypothetical protein MZV70_03435 [Desulfobacterales bacterium]|nr:hypothetical protein [Desulfobacterales bacterium]